VGEKVGEKVGTLDGDAVRISVDSITVGACVEK